MRAIVKILPDRNVSTVSEAVPDTVAGILYSPAKKAVGFFQTSDGVVGFVDDDGNVETVPRRVEVDHPIAACCDEWGIAVLQASPEILWTFDQSFVATGRMCGQRAYMDMANLLPADPMMAFPCAMCRTDRRSVVFVAPWVHRVIGVFDGLRVDFLGSGRKGFMSSADPRASLVDSPSGVSFDALTRSVFVADTGNSVVRVFRDRKEVAFVGTPGKAGRQDGQGASARLERPAAIAANGGVAYVADGERIVAIDARSLSTTTIRTAGSRIVSLAAGAGCLYSLEVI